MTCVKGIDNARSRLCSKGRVIVLISQGINAEVATWAVSISAQYADWLSIKCPSLFNKDREIVIDTLTKFKKLCKTETIDKNIWHYQNFDDLFYAVKRVFALKQAKNVN